MEHPARESLSQCIARSDPRDAERQTAHEQRARSLAEVLEGSEEFELAESLALAAELCHLLLEPPEAWAERILALAGQIVAGVEDSLAGVRLILPELPTESVPRSVPGSVPAAGGVPPAKDPAHSEGAAPEAPTAAWRLLSRQAPRSMRLDLETGLRLQNERLLGDILVQLGMVSAETLERALARQRASGELIGESLVQMGALTWEQVRRAMGIQQQLKRASRRCFRH